MRLLCTILTILFYSLTNINCGDDDYMNADKPCQPRIRCPSSVAYSKFRSINGSCNNLDHSSWGSFESRFHYELPPAYDDGYNSPRQLATDGSPLPSARKVSQAVFLNGRGPKSTTNFLLDQFGLYFDHDWTLTPNIGPTNCCTTETLHSPKCFPIMVAEDDVFYSQFNVTCLNFKRSSTLVGKCAPIRTQFNRATSWIDGGPTYGRSAHQARVLRTLNGGLLRTSIIHGRESLPKLPDGKALCNIKPSRTRKCFDSGDPRVNLSVQVACVHTLILREHNRIVRILARLNPHWGDERLYQEGRRIVGAILQHIAYNDALPLFLGQDAMVKYHLYSKPSGYHKGYNPKLDGGTGIAANIAFRFHPQVPGRPYLIRSDNTRHYFNMSDQVEAPSLLYGKGNYDGLLKGMVTDGVQTTSRYISSELTNKLYKKYLAPYGGDLGAVDVQRCRDHGLPVYNAYREHCGLKKFKSFREMIPYVYKDVVPVLETLYRHVDDIDLVVGARSELHGKDALTGPTNVCILGDSFKRFKYGDRYWYENDFKYMRFSLDQLAEIKKATISRIVCDNSDRINRMPLNGFKVPSNSNPMVSCNQTVGIDLNLWQEVV